MEGGLKAAERDRCREVCTAVVQRLLLRPMSTDQLLADGSIVSLTVTNAELAAALQVGGAGDMAPEVAPRGGPTDTYLDLKVALATPAMIGQVAIDARRDLQLLERRGPAADHPVAVTCRESAYLKCIISRVW